MRDRETRIKVRKEIQDFSTIKQLGLIYMCCAEHSTLQVACIFTQYTRLSSEFTPYVNSQTKHELIFGRFVSSVLSDYNKMD